MIFKQTHYLSCDVLIIGGGGAGLKAAIEAKTHGSRVVIASKSRVGFTNNTYISKALIAAGGLDGAQDDRDIHLKDTVRGGRFLNDQGLAAVMIGKAKEQITFLETCGVDFGRKQGKLPLAHAAGHTNPRHVRGKHRIGSDIILPLKNYAKKIGVVCMDHIFITKLFARPDRIVGASGISEDGCFYVFTADCIVLATGGFAQAYLYTNNAAHITGDGHIPAFELGVPLRDMEFVQFYPTAVGNRGKQILLYETLVLHGGAVLKNDRGEDIIAKHDLKDPMRLTRDRLARAVMSEIQEGRDTGGRAVMDLSPMSKDKINALRSLLPLGRIPETMKLPVSPTTHFCMGGVVVDHHGETAVPGLFAAGEICGGIHGANRLAGNALCEAFSLGSVAGKQAALKATESGPPPQPAEEAADEQNRLASFFSSQGNHPKPLIQSLKETMWRHAGILRNRESLRTALDHIETLKGQSADPLITKQRDLIRHLELNNLLTLSEMVCRAALMRTESRGAHFRSDYPDENPTDWLKNIFIRRRPNGRMSLQAVPTQPEFLSPPE